MPRAARQKSESKIYHVLVRGINRQTIFEDGEDASKYLITLKRYKGDDAYKLYAYCLMGNHQNPVKAHIAEEPASYRWSSFAEYLGHASVGLVDVDFVLNMFHKDTENALNSFREFHRGSSEGAFLDTEENKRITDEAAIDIIKKICQVQHCKEVQFAEKEKRDHYLKIMKDKGLSTRQIARLTGIKRNIIFKGLEQNECLSGLNVRCRRGGIHFNDHQNRPLG